MPLQRGKVLGYDFNRMDAQAAHRARPADKIVHRRGADRTPHCLALIKHREINDSTRRSI